MASRRIYTATVPASALSQDAGRSTGRKQLARLAELAGDGSVDATGTSPGDLQLSGETRGKYAEIIATELRELLSAPGYESLEVYGVDEDMADAGYYTTESVTAGRTTPQSGTFNSYDATLVHEGTRNTRLRAVGTSIATLDNDFGNAETPHVGIPETASFVRWFDVESGALEESPTVVSTVTGEHGDVDLYDPSSASFSNPTLTFDLPYADAGNVDAAVFDTYGNSEVDSDGDYAWGQVFKPGHEFRGEAVLDNTLIRVYVDDEARTMSAEEWDAGTSSWTSISLGASDWTIEDLDLTALGRAQVMAQLTFRDTTDDSLYALDARLIRGWDRVLFTTPSRDTQGATPTGLVDLLDPIAASSMQSPGASAGLVVRSETRK